MNDGTDYSFSSHGNILDTNHHCFCALILYMKAIFGNTGDNEPSHSSASPVENSESLTGKKLEQAQARAQHTNE